MLKWSFFYIVQKQKVEIRLKESGMTLLKAPSNINNGNLNQFAPLDMCDLSLSSIFAGTSNLYAQLKRQAVIVKVKLR